MLDYLVSLVKYVFFTIINFLIEAFAAIISTIARLLPDSPFLEANTNFGFLQGIPYIEHVTWLIPISSMISTLALFVVAYLGYYVLKIVLKVLKMI